MWVLFLVFLHIFSLILFTRKFIYIRRNLLICWERQIYEKKRPVKIIRGRDPGCWNYIITKIIIIIITIFKLMTNYFKNNLQVFLFISFFFITSKEIRGPVYSYFPPPLEYGLSILSQIFLIRRFRCVFQVFFPSRFLVFGLLTFS